MIGQTLRGYDIKSELGAGGYGAVYLAYDSSVNRDVAIKVILPQYANDADFKQRFEIEAHLVAQLEHPHIIPLYRYWHDEQGAFLVMRFVRGGSLSERIKTQGALPLSQVERWLTHLCGALGLAHQQGVVHRDLKPDNVLLDDLGNAYLTDFGIAKQIQQADKLTATDSIMGTWHYISPEQIQSDPVSPASDIYALGIMLYEMLVGEHPFKDATVTMIIMKHLQEPLPDLSSVRPDLPLALNDVIQKATAKDVQDRYQTTSNLLDDFKDALTLKIPSPTASSTIVEDDLKPIPLSQEERNRNALLTNVRTFWVEGVLEQSLYNMVWIELGMAERSDAVENPWQTVLKVPDTPDEMLSSGTTISEVFDRLQGKMLILGEPGSGKTTTLLTLARDLLRRADWDAAHPMPVVFNLSSWSQNRKSLADWMIDELNLKYQVPRKMGQRWVEAEQILPLLDGLDEVADAHRDTCVETINAYRTEHGFVDVVVCSRINDYNALTHKLRLNGAITLQPLQREQVDVYLAQAGDGLSAVRQVLEDDEKLRRLTTSPLMLNILTLAYRDLSVDEIQQFDTVDGRRKHLFDMYVDRMLERRGTDQPYTLEQTKQYLSWLGKNMSQRALSVLYIEGLQYDWMNTSFQGNLFTLILRSPLLLLLFPLFVSLTIVGLLKLFPFGFPNMFLYIIIFWFALYVYFIAGVFDIVPLPDFLLFKQANQIKSVERIHWSLPSKIRLIYARWISGHIFAGFILWVILILFFGIIDSLESAINSLIIISLAYGFFGVIGTSIAILFRSIQTSEISIRARTNQGIVLSLRNFGGITFIVSLIVFIVGYMLTQSGSSLGIVLLILLMLFSPFIILRFGGATVIKHLLLRIMLWFSGQMPRKIANFLDYASSRILMRKVGGGYVFIHRLLLEYFATLDSTDAQIVSSESVTDHVNQLADSMDTDTNLIDDTDSSLEQYQNNE